MMETTQHKEEEEKKEDYLYDLMRLGLIDLFTYFLYVSFLLFFEAIPLLLLYDAISSI